MVEQPPTNVEPNRRTVLKAGFLAGGLLGISSLLAACGGSSGSAKSTGDVPGAAGAAPTGALRLLYQGGARDAPGYEQMIARFKAKYPGMSIETVADPSTTWADFFTNVQVKVAGGQHFDLIYLPTEGQRLFAAKGLLSPVDAWIKRDQPEVDAFLADADATLVKDARELSSPDGKTYFLPYVFNTMCIWYRPSVLKAANAPMPTEDWTWDDFYATAKAATKPDRKAYGFHCAEQDFSGIEPWLLTNGARVLSADWKTSTINSPEAVEAVSFARKLVADGISPKPGGTFDAIAALTKGQVAMIGCGRWAIEAARSGNVVDDLAVVPWPKKKQQGSPVGWGSYGVLKSSKNKDGAWAFIKFLLQQDTQDFIAEAGFGGVAPARKSSATGSHMLQNSPKGTENIYNALAYSTPVPGTDKSNLIEQAIANTYGQILAGATDPVAGIQQLDSAVRGAL
jgi:multiple sugar transport system substrate-binding protein